MLYKILLSEESSGINHAHDNKKRILLMSFDGLDIWKGSSRVAVWLWLLFFRNGNAQTNNWQNNHGHEKANVYYFVNVSGHWQSAWVMKIDW